MSGACVGCGPSVSFSGQVQPIFDADCTTACHSGARPAGGLSLVAGSSHGELVNVTSTCSGRKYVVPSSPQTSYLMNKLTGVGMCAGSIMPKIGGELSQSQIESDSRLDLSGRPQKLASYAAAWAVGRLSARLPPHVDARTINGDAQASRSRGAPTPRRSTPGWPRLRPANWEQFPRLTRRGSWRASRTALPSALAARTRMIILWR